MIPKIIHYCWFGGKEVPQSAKKYIESWKKFLPGYEIKRWDESNFEVNAIKYTREAYAAKKYAFVSDYARFWILFNYGGLYFDTDVEVIKPLEDIISKGAYLGVESQNDTTITVAPVLLREFLVRRHGKLSLEGFVYTHNGNVQIQTYFL